MVNFHSRRSSEYSCSHRTEAPASHPTIQADPVTTRLLLSVVAHFVVANANTPPVPILLVHEDISRGPLVVIRGVNYGLKGRPTDTEPPSKSRMSMAHAAYPTMVLILLAYHKMHGYAFNRLAQHGDNIEWADLPPGFVLYGITFDEEGAVLWAHVPYSHMNDDSSCCWRFYQYPVEIWKLPSQLDEEENPDASMLVRWRFIIALLTIRRQAEILRDKLVSILSVEKCDACI